MPKGRPRLRRGDEPNIFVAVLAHVVHIADAIALSWQIALGLHAPLCKARSRQASERDTIGLASLVSLCGLLLACVCSLSDCFHDTGTEHSLDLDHLWPASSAARAWCHSSIALT